MCSPTILLVLRTVVATDIEMATGWGSMVASPHASIEDKSRIEIAEHVIRVVEQ